MNKKNKVALMYTLGMMMAAGPAYEGEPYEYAERPKPKPIRTAPPGCHYYHFDEAGEWHRTLTERPEADRGAIAFTCKARTPESARKKYARKLLNK